MELAFRTTAQDMGDGAYVAMTQNSPYDKSNPAFQAFAKKWSEKYGDIGYNDTLLTQPFGFQFYEKNPRRHGNIGTLEGYQRCYVYF
jgi:hypothetical protein